MADSMVGDISLQEFREHYLGLYNPSDVIPDTTSPMDLGGMVDTGMAWQCRVVGTNVPKLIYLAGPYRPYVDGEGVRHTIAQNVADAAKYGVEVWKRGFVAVVPHTMTYFPRLQKQNGGITGVEPEVFLRGELELLARCDILVMLPTWRVSAGATAERDYALKLGIPVLEWDQFVEEAR